ncbi:Pycsar system effector family protein [Pedobacter sp. L105]|uniref:Pycsar system effector family protein n=1 Tax=Pedobacter sp. L105 TaxID=1641871 RepID=UPI00131B1BD9|nr:Pycsar system effector family protein [Pedobacter sp. L105]
MKEEQAAEEILPVTEVDYKTSIDMLLKITAGNDHRLSDMADNKAQILITVNSIILSAIISLVLGRLRDTQYLIIPSFILLATSLITLILAILSTRPKLPNGKFTARDLSSKRVNLLFFGNFYRMKIKDYSSGMTHILTDDSFLYESLIKDSYAQGVVLGRKYRLLRLAYNVFMFGLIIVILVFLQSIILDHNLFNK